MHIILGGLNLPRPGSNSVNSVLLSVISNMGFTYSYEGVGDIFLNLDHSKRCLDNWNAKNEESKPKVLIRLETESVFPMQYSLKIESRYSKVYTLGTFDKSFSELELGFPYGPTINHCNQSESLNFIEVFNQNKEDEIYSTR
jgi:hypothetical protein